MPHTGCLDNKLLLSLFETYCALMVIWGGLYMTNNAMDLIAATEWLLCAT